MPTRDPALPAREVACHFWKEIANAGAVLLQDAEPSKNFRRRLDLFRSRNEQLAATGYSLLDNASMP